MYTRTVNKVEVCDEITFVLMIIIILTTLVYTLSVYQFLTINVNLDINSRPFCVKLFD